MTEAIVTTDKLTYRHPESNPAPGQAHTMVEADRGDLLSTEESDDPFALPAISEKELKRGEAQGALTTDLNSLTARLAKAKTPREAGVSAPYAALTSESELRSAAKAVAQMGGGASPTSPKSDLAMLALPDLARLAATFGAPADVLESEDKETILDFLAGDDENAEDSEDAAKRTQMRDVAQVKSREHAQAEPGRVGTNVTGSGADATTGLDEHELPEGVESEEPKTAPRRQSRAAQKPADSGK